MEVDESGNDRLSANILDSCVLWDRDGPRLSGGHDMIAFDNKHRVLDGRPACSIDQKSTFEHGLLRLGLRANSRAGGKRSKNDTQDHPGVRTNGSFHFAPPY
jgi:hypothetical protein